MSEPKDPEEIFDRITSDDVEAEDQVEETTYESAEVDCESY